MVSACAENMNGTSAEMLAGEIYSIEQLLYAMMLPSGNDAAVALAEWGGRVLLSGKAHPKNKDYQQAFVRHMNSLSSSLELRMTHWANPHGLPNAQNKSTAFDMARLCARAMEDPVFRKVVATRCYETVFQNVEGD